MAVLEYFCMGCDAHFTLKMDMGFDVKYCPCCGEALSIDDVNDIDE